MAYYILCAVAAELCGCSCCMLLKSLAVCCVFLLGQDVPQYENKMPRSDLRNTCCSHIYYASCWVNT